MSMVASARRDALTLARRRHTHRRDPPWMHSPPPRRTRRESTRASARDRRWRGSEARRRRARRGARHTFGSATRRTCAQAVMAPLKTSEYSGMWMEWCAHVSRKASSMSSTRMSTWRSAGSASSIIRACRRRSSSVVGVTSVFAGPAHRDELIGHTSAACASAMYTSTTRPLHADASRESELIACAMPRSGGHVNDPATRSVGAPSQTARRVVGALPLSSA